MTDDFIWTVRTFIYQHFASTAHAPSAAEVAHHFGLTTEQAEEILLALHAQHALFLEPGTTTIRMANPFSAIPTAFTVIIHHTTYYANCAWDAFGIAAALHASEAEIHATCAEDDSPLRLRITNGQVVDTEAVIHFLVPFQHWYDDLVFT